MNGIEYLQQQLVAADYNCLPISLNRKTSHGQGEFLPMTPTIKIKCHGKNNPWHFFVLNNLEGE